MHSNFISYPVIKLLAQESKKEQEKESIESKSSKYTEWLSMFYHTFFSTGIETNKEKET